VKLQKLYEFSEPYFVPVAKSVNMLHRQVPGTHSLSACGQQAK